MTSNTNSNVPKTIYDECKDVATFSKHMMRFFNYAMGLPALSELHPAIRRGYKFYSKEDKKNYIIKLHGIMEPHITLISQYDEGIFSNDYTSGSMKLIPGIDFKLLFRALPQEHKKQMFIHLQTIYISAEMAKNQLCKIGKVFKKQKAFMFNMIKNLNLDETIKSKIEQLEKEEEDEEGSSWANFDFSKLSELKEIFGDDNPITKLIKELIAEVNTDGISAEGITNSLAERMQRLIKVFLAKIQAKFMTGEVSMASLTKDVSDIIEKVSKVFPAIKEYINPEMLHAAFFGGNKKKKAENGESVDSDDTDTDSDADADEDVNSNGVDPSNINFEEIGDKLSSGMEGLFDKLKESGIDLNKNQESGELLDTIKSTVNSITENLSDSGMISQLKQTMAQFM
jgi:hypothetical protein